MVCLFGFYLTTAVYFLFFSDIGIPYSVYLKKFTKTLKGQNSKVLQR